MMFAINHISSKAFSFFACSLLFFVVSCTHKSVDPTMPYKVSSNSQWVIDLQQKNPLKDSANYTSVYFRFDTILNNFEVSGILYPRPAENYGWEAHESGVRLFFHNIKTDKEYIWTNMDKVEDEFKPYFMSVNVTNIICDKHSKAFKNGDTYIFLYDTTTAKYANNPLLPYAEYQFYDADYDGEDELILGYYVGGPHGSPSYDIYELTDAGLVRKDVEGESYFWLDESTKFDPENKMITNRLHEGAYAWGDYVYEVDDKGKIHRRYHVYFVSDFDHNILSADATFYQ